MNFRQWVKLGLLRDDMIGDLCRDLDSDYDFDGTQRYVKAVTKNQVSRYAANILILEYKDYNYEEKLIKQFYIETLFDSVENI